jgi:hypothetical protein
MSSLPMARPCARRNSVLRRASFPSPAGRSYNPLTLTPATYLKGNIMPTFAIPGSTVAAAVLTIAATALLAIAASAA